MMDSPSTSDLIPLVDISPIIDKSIDFFDEAFQYDPTVKKLVEDISVGFTRWGFLYIKGHGISQEEVDSTFEGANNFFQLKRDQKMNVLRGSGISVGYVPGEGEVFDQYKPNDLKEAFDFVPSPEMSKKLQSVAPDMLSSSSNLFEHCKVLVHKLLRLLAMALNLDMEHFVKQHKNIGDHNQNGTSLRLLYYPEISANHAVKTDQFRCGEHTDYGTMTLLYQDGVSGLEVKSPSGQYIQAVPIPGTIVINAADLLHTWSGGKFKATMHRVVPTGKKRQSIAFFTHPDYYVDIDHQDEEGNEATRNAHDHLKEMFDRTIQVQ